eukprot:gene4740-9412_t
MLRKIRASTNKWPSGIRILPMPCLSPSMTSGRIDKWHINSGDVLNSYDLLLDVIAEDLTNTGHAESSVLEIEIQEPMILVKILCKEGEDAKPGKPIAILCDDVTYLKDSQHIHLLEDLNLYENNPLEIPSVIWQAYVKKKDDPGACGCS